MVTRSITRPASPAALIRATIPREDVTQAGELLAEAPTLLMHRDEIRDAMHEAALSALQEAQRYLDRGSERSLKLAAKIREGAYATLREVESMGRGR